MAQIHCTMQLHAETLTQDMALKQNFQFISKSAWIPLTYRVVDERQSDHNSAKNVFHVVPMIGDSRHTTHRHPQEIDDVRER